MRWGRNVSVHNRRFASGLLWRHARLPARYLVGRLLQQPVYADIVIANASIHHVAFSLCSHLSQFDRLRAEARSREVFTACFAVYLGVDGRYDFGGADYLFVLDTAALDIDERALTPENCPILVMVPPKPEGQEGRSVVVGAMLPYEYRDSWLTGGTKHRGPEYHQLKEEVKGRILDRVCGRLGDEFRKAIKFAVAATPLTFERYTYNEKGSIMGWRMGKTGYGRFIPFKAPVKNLYFVGHWVFPGGGVPSVMASGYYLACQILKGQGVDLAAKVKAFTG